MDTKDFIFAHVLKKS